MFKDTDLHKGNKVNKLINRYLKFGSNSFIEAFKEANTEKRGRVLRMLNQGGSFRYGRDIEHLSSVAVKAFIFALSTLVAGIMILSIFISNFFAMLVSMVVAAIVYNIIKNMQSTFLLEKIRDEVIAPESKMNLKKSFKFVYKH